MYLAVTPWNVFKGCRFQCSYCKPSFQAQAKRQLHNCRACYDFTPHEHKERLGKMPKGDIIWPGSSGDISFCDSGFLQRIIIKTWWNLDKTYYFQSKNPKCFNQYLRGFSPKTILLTTLETNRDVGYDKISKAPPPSVRARDFAALPWPRKIVTIEPIMDFDIVDFFEMIMACKPEAVYIGFNSKPKAVRLPEPDLFQARNLIKILKSEGIQVIEKTMREKS